MRMAMTSLRPTRRAHSRVGNSYTGRKGMTPAPVTRRTVVGGSPDPPTTHVVPSVTRPQPAQRQSLDELDLDRRRDDAGTVALVEQTADGGAAALAVVERPVVDIH